MAPLLLVPLLLVMVGSLATLPHQQKFDVEGSIILNQISIHQIQEEQRGFNEGIKSLLKQIETLTNVVSTKLTLDDRSIQAGEHKNNITQHLMREVEDLKQKLLRRDETLAEKDETIQQQQNRIQQQQETVTERDQSMQELQNRIQQQQEMVTERDQSIQELQNRIQQQQETVIERDQTIQELQNRIQQQQKTFQEKEEILRLTKEEKRVLEEELLEVHEDKSQVEAAAAAAAAAATSAAAAAAAAAQLLKVEESHVSCESQVKNLTQNNEEVSIIKSQQQVNITLLENITQHTQELRNKLLRQLSDCQHNVTDIKKISLPARDCSDVQHKGATQSGVYQIFPQSSAGGVSVFCKMQEENMWTVFLARYRQITQVSFSKGWEDYKTGFGDPHGEYWLGNNNLHALTSGGRRYQLKVIATNLRGEQLSAVWETFSVADEANEYRVIMGGYTSTSTLNDALTSEHDWANLNGSSFTTVDSDHDTWSGVNCAQHLGSGGGWWYNDCGWVSPTSPLGNTDYDPRVMSWGYFFPDDRLFMGLSQLLMMITPYTTATTQH
ncbi:angiopoietin-1 isoform X2 [Cherax quadricarinatus]|uniref:angiopoietin-1 isoform X2 n=1 Tax=Cherax quadricarinatus TaxID=27406 RepID=UPI00387EB920